MLIGMNRRKTVRKASAIRVCTGVLLAGILACTGGCGNVSSQETEQEPAVMETRQEQALSEVEPAVAEVTTDEGNLDADDEDTAASVAGENRDGASSQVTICMVGDILLHTPIEDASRRDDGTYDYSHIFSETTDLISDADIALVNEEVIIGGAELGVSGYPAFNASYEIGDALVDAGFDVVLHATNHVLDKGAKGLTNCYDYWENEHPEIEVLGIHDSPEDQAHISVLEVDGISIAFLNYTYGTNGIPVPSDMPYSVDLLEENRVIADLAAAEEMADFTIVCPHWGTEYRLTPDSYQQKWAKIFAENGADLVIGTHPHVIEPIEWISADGSSSDAKAATGEMTKTVPGTLVYYSLGNYVNWTSGTGPGTANRMVGGMAQVTLARDDDGDVVIDDYGVAALVTDLREGRDGVTVYRLKDYTADQADENAIRSQDPSFSYEYCVSLCNDVWGDLWE